MKITLFSYNASHYHTALAIRILRDVLCDMKISESIPMEITLAEHSLKDKRLSVLSHLVSEDSDIYAFSVYIWNITETLAIAENLKKLRPESKIIFGGPEVSFRAEEILSDNPYIDTVICFEGEEAIKKAVRSYPDMPKIIIGEQSSTFLTQKPHYFLPDGTPEALEKGRFIYYESSRGCPYRCGYCLSGDTPKIAAKSVEETLSDLKMLEMLPGGKRTVKLVDRTFNFDLTRAKAIWKALKSEEYTHCYHFEIQPSLIDGEALEILSDIPEGKFQFEAGVQSTNTEVLRECNRKADIEKELYNLDLLRRRTSIPIHADLICGLPLEDIESIKHSVNEVYYVSDELQLGFLKLLSGTAIAKNAKDYGMVSTSEPPYEVLCTEKLSFEDMYRLHGIAALLDRVSNSGKFKNTLEMMVGKKERGNSDGKVTPFEFFDGFLKYISVHPSAIGQSAMYEKLYSYCLRYCNQDTERIALKEACFLDFTTNERTRIPGLLK